MKLHNKMNIMSIEIIPQQNNMPDNIIREMTILDNH